MCNSVFMDKEINTVLIEIQGYKGRWTKLIQDKIDRKSMPIKVETPWPCYFDKRYSMDSTWPCNFDNCQGVVLNIVYSKRKWWAECFLFDSQPLSMYDPMYFTLKVKKTEYNNKVTDILYFYPANKND